MATNKDSEPSVGEKQAGKMEMLQQVNDEGRTNIDSAGEASASEDERASTGKKTDKKEELEKKTTNDSNGLPKKGESTPLLQRRLKSRHLQMIAIGMPKPLRRKTCANEAGDRWYNRYWSVYRVRRSVGKGRTGGSAHCIHIYRLIGILHHDVAR